MTRLLDFFSGAYAGRSLQVRKKSRILAIMAIGFGLVSLLFAILMAATGAILVAAVFIGIAAFCATVLALLRAGRYGAASSLFLYGLFAAMFVAIKFDQYQDVYETYVMGTLGCFLLVVTTLVGDKPRQAITIGALFLAAIEAIYWLDSFPKDGKVTTLAVQNLATSSLMVALGAAVAAYLVRLTSGLIAEVEREAQSAQESFESLNAAMGEAQSSSQRIGEELSSSVERTSVSIETLRGRVETIESGMDELDGALERAGDSNRLAEDCQAEVKTALSAYSDQVARASSAIEEMAAAASSLAKQAAGKKDAVKGLVEAARAGQGVLLSMAKSMEQIRQSAREVAELGGIIGDVADRTNLLGMNASIEAAHAGVAGKGFAVVASEIRALSVETSKSARVISETLKRAQADIETAGSRSGEAMDSFKKMAEDVGGISLMLEELIASVQELSAGSSEVTASVEAVADLTRSTEGAVERSCASMGETLTSMEVVAEVASHVRVEIGEMSTSFGVMRGDSEEVRRLGGENLGTIQALKKRLEGFGRAASPSSERGRVWKAASTGIVVKRKARLLK
jgi:Methyl-accepting chemotaxis protein